MIEFFHIRAGKGRELFLIELYCFFRGFLEKILRCGGEFYFDDTAVVFKRQAGKISIPYKRIHTTGQLRAGDIQLLRNRGHGDPAGLREKEQDLGLGLRHDIF